MTNKFKFTCKIGNIVSLSNLLSKMSKTFLQSVQVLKNVMTVLYYFWFFRSYFDNVFNDINSFVNMVTSS